MYCPECGNDAGSAKFCPECGANLSGVKNALSGKTGGEKAAKQGGGSGAATAAAASAGGPKRLSPVVIWVGFGVLALVVVVVVMMVSGGFGSKSPTGNTAGASGAAVQQVSADTSGSYSDLVARANGLYDQGDKAFKAQQFEQGGAYFAAAAKVYAAAWKKQATDPGVGTDYATALFYSGAIDEAVAQAEAVIAKSPQFQNAWLTKGNALAHKARIADQAGKKADAQQFYSQARRALTQAVSIDPSSAGGKLADAALQSLPK